MSKKYYTSSIYEESIRSIRTNIEFSDIDNKKKTIAVTSSKPSEGKTTLIYNLAKSFAQNGESVVVVDFDLRMPKLGDVAGIETNMGVTNVITGKVDLDRALIKDQYEDNLTVLLSGPTPPNPAEILASDHVKDLIERLKEKFDYVF